MTIRFLLFVTWGDDSESEPKSHIYSMYHENYIKIEELNLWHLNYMVQIGLIEALTLLLFHLDRFCCRAPASHISTYLCGPYSYSKYLGVILLRTYGYGNIPCQIGANRCRDIVFPLSWI